MCKKVEKVIYWLTLVGPVIDVLKGTVLGLISAYKAVKSEREAMDLNRKEQEMREQFNRDNM